MAYGGTKPAANAEIYPVAVPFFDDGPAGRRAIQAGQSHMAKTIYAFPGVAVSGADALCFCLFVGNKPSGPYRFNLMITAAY